MVRQYDKNERGVGPQNFQYAPAYEEMCHIISIHSPKAYRSLQQHFPMPALRTLRRKEAREPCFPMEIGEHTFELVTSHLATLNYKGPMGLSCDDTKLFATYCLYWDSLEGCYFLIGAVEGPLRVATPDAVQSVLEETKAHKANKVSICIPCENRMS